MYIHFYLVGACVFLLSGHMTVGTSFFVLSLGGPVSWTEDPIHISMASTPLVKHMALASRPADPEVMSKSGHSNVKRIDKVDGIYLLYLQGLVDHRH